MTDLIINTLIGLGLLSIAYNLWGMRCSNVALRQIREMLRAVQVFDMREEVKLELIKGIASVTFKAHMDALIWFSDPMRLYPANVRNLMGVYRNSSPARPLWKSTTRHLS